MSKRRPMQAVYMHTLDRQPASFDEASGMVLFAYHGPGTRCVQLVVPSLRQLRREQGISQRTRPEVLGGPDEFRYGFVRLHVNTGETP